MGRKHDRGPRDSGGSWEPAERTLAAAEEEEREVQSGGGQSSTGCACGSKEFLLEAYLHVVDGVARPEPVEVESLSCPACGREYEAVLGEQGRILRGDFLGYVDAEE